MLYINQGLWGPVVKQYSISITGKNFEITNATGKSWNTDYLSIHAIKDIFKLFDSVHYLAGFLQNSVISNTAHEYVSRHKVVKKFMRWLPSAKALNQVYGAVSKVNFKDLSKKNKIILFEDDLYLANHFQKLINDNHSVLEKGFFDGKQIIDLASALNTHKIIPGHHGRIDYDYKATRPGGWIDQMYGGMVLREIQGYKNPSDYLKAENPQKAKKAWKVNNQKWSFVNDFNNQLDKVAFVENTFYNIEKVALHNAYVAYQKGAAKSDPKNECLRLADKAYLQTLFKQDKIWYDNPKYHNSLWYYLYGAFFEEVLFHELRETKQLFHVQNDRYLRKLRLDILLTRYKVLDILSIKYTTNYSGLQNWIDKHYEKSGFDRFWIDLGKACWDIIKFPFSTTYVFWKDLLAGDNIFYSYNQSLITGYKDLLGSIDDIFGALKLLVDKLNHVLRSIEWLGAHSIFFWTKDIPGNKKFWSDFNDGFVYVEKGTIFIAKAIVEIPLHLAKDLDKLSKGLFFWITDQETFGQMLYHDFEPIAKTAIRLGTFVDHIATGNEKVMKQKISRVRSLLHFRKTQEQVKIAFQIDKKDRNIRHTLHKETFGLIKSPFQKFRERHRKEYPKLRKANASFVSGYCISHVDAAIAEQQLHDIFWAITHRPTKAKIDKDLSRQSSIWQKKYQHLKPSKKFQEYNKLTSMSQAAVDAILRKVAVNQLDRYYHINLTQNNIKKLEAEDRQGLHIFEKKEGVLKIGSVIANELESWSASVLQRNKKDAKLIYALPHHGFNLFLIYDLYGGLLQLQHAFKKEQKVITNDWTHWGKVYGEGISKALEDFVLPEFIITKSASSFYGWSIPITINGVNNEMISSKQFKKLKAYDNKHRVGEKIFDVIMWTFFLNSYGITGDYFAKKVFVNAQINGSTSNAIETHALNYGALPFKKINALSLRANRYWRDFRFFYDNYRYLSVIINSPMPSLKLINSHLKAFANGATINNLILSRYFGKYLANERKVLLYDYDTERYSAWKKEQLKIHPKKWNYLKEDRQVLKYQAQLNAGTSSFITVGDVLKTFTPEGIKTTQVDYTLDFGTTPPAPQPLPLPLPQPPVRTKTFIVLDLTTKQIAKTTKVSPLAIFGQSKFLNHIAKATANKSLKPDAKNISKSFIDSDEFKAKTRLAWEKERSNVNSLLRERELKAIENETRVMEKDFEKKAPGVIEDYFEKADTFVDTQVDDVVTQISDVVSEVDAELDALIDV